MFHLLQFIPLAEIEMRSRQIADLALVAQRKHAHLVALYVEAIERDVAGRAV